MRQFLSWGTKTPLQVYGGAMMLTGALLCFSVVMTMNALYDALVIMNVLEDPPPTLPITGILGGIGIALFVVVTFVFRRRALDLEAELAGEVTE